MAEYDQVIVIGSGPCGAIAAARLIERGLNVTMLDSGLGRPKGMVVRAAGNTIYRRMDPDRLETDRHDRATQAPVDWYSSLSHGGLSNYWTAAVPRFAPEDFTDGQRLDERYEWPVGYEELVPYYEAAERMLVVTAGAPFANIPANVVRYRTNAPPDWAELAARLAANGHSLGPMPMAKGRPWMAARRGTEFNSYYSIVEPLLKSPRFALVSAAHVTKLVYSARTGVVESVDYVDRRTKIPSVVHGRAVVVAAGAIDSTCILLRSVSKTFPNGLGNSAGLIGRYLHDHPREWWTALLGRNLTALSHPIYLSRDSYDSAAPLMATSLTIGLATTRDRVPAFVRGKVSAVGVQVFGTMVPTDEVGVSLPMGLEAPPRITLSYDRDIIRNIHSSRQRLIDVFATAGMNVTVPGPFHELTPGSSVHYGGSVRMHASREFGALDRWNRLYDVQNVVVCDSSCFTTGPEKNPTLTAMAIAGRAADHLADDLAD